MATITKGAGAALETGPFGRLQGDGPAPDSMLRPSGHRLGPLTAGEALGHLAPCYISSDGKVYQSNGTAANAAAKVHGWSIGAVPSGGPVWLSYDFIAYYAASGLTPGSWIYLDSTAGQISTTATTGGTGCIGICLDGQRILFLRSIY
jgi:hypothetical protein